MKRLDENEMLGCFQDLADSLTNLMNRIGDDVHVTDDNVTDWLDIHHRAQTLLTDLDLIRFDAGQRDVIDAAAFRAF